MTVNHNAGVHASTEPNPKLAELTERLSGRWRVTGPGIDGMADYKSMRDGLLLVANVNFVVNGTEIKLIQHIAYEQDTDTLRAHYMDTMGDESTYTWVLDGQELRVSLGDKVSDTYFVAEFDDDNSEYVGMWHYPEGDIDNSAAEEQIIYTRIG